MTPFPSCIKVHDDKVTRFSEYVYILNDNSAELDKRFQNFQLIQNNQKILSNPFTAEVEKEPAKLELERFELKLPFILGDYFVHTFSSVPMITLIIMN